MDDDDGGHHGHDGMADDGRGRHRVTLPAPPPPFQRQSLGRCSVQQPMMGNSRSAATHYSDGGGMVSEYFIPRSVSAHDLCSSIELQKIPPPLPPSALRTTAATLARPPRAPTASRDKMVTFEDEKLAFGPHHHHHQHHLQQQNHHHQQQQQHHRSSGDLIV
ncbi:Hypothetical protein CINCED_3A019307 [Cinara cedri]|uniref:Uncharacterized protein n=1 Tax=Cinara cedri TaxID=506608 RepID=A0A5E4M9N8_9HEMI|nr:Hypothetical protein CINCED_3A019307 [Cinara cedri]